MPPVPALSVPPDWVKRLELTVTPLVLAIAPLAVIVTEPPLTVVAPL